MKHLPVSLAALALLSGASLRAATYTDIQYRHAFAEADGKAITGTFNIVTPGSSTYSISGYGAGNGTFSDDGGYVLGTDLVSLVASFYIRDDSSRDGREKVDINLGYSPREVNNLTLVNGGSTLISFGGSTALVNFLEQNGILRYRIKSEEGDFRLEYAMLTATTASFPTLPSNRVPDGGLTLGLLGFSIAGLVGMNRKVKKRG